MLTRMPAHAATPIGAFTGVHNGKGLGGGGNGERDEGDGRDFVPRGRRTRQEVGWESPAVDPFTNLCEHIVNNFQNYIPKVPVFITSHK